MATRADRIAKYDAVAGGYSGRYRDPDTVARRQVDLVTRWGAVLGPRATVLELGCADGFVTAALARAGLAVTAMDLSPAMVAEAAATLARARCAAELRIADVDSYRPERDYDATLGLMWTFFAYAADPETTLRRLAERTRRKLLVDVNPRQLPLSVAVAHVRAAGFDDVRWRPFLVPQRHRLPGFLLRLVRGVEVVPGVRALPLRYRFVAVVKGERRGSLSCSPGPPDLYSGPEAEGWRPGG